MNGTLNYEELKQRNPWIIQRERNAILSPDADGFLSGLLMAKFLDWRICGYYDGKRLLLKQGLSANDCIFLDVDIFRQNIHSIGHHMVLFDKSRVPGNWSQFDNCIQANNLRLYDFVNNFPLKYPLATVHLLLGILGSAMTIDIQRPALCPLFFADGTFQNLFTYPENVLDWIRFLGGLNTASPLNRIFCNEHYSVHTLMVAMDDFFRKRDAICSARQMGPRERGDRLIISDRNGNPYNIVNQNATFKIEDNAKNRAEQFLVLLAGLTGWEYEPEEWCWEEFAMYTFTKGILTPGVGNYNRVITQNPVSFALTGREKLEYTLENPDTLP